MLGDLKSGRINCVIVKDISRLGRHFVLTSEFVERTFPEMGVRFICINDSYDSTDENADASVLTMPLKMVVNDYYVKDISNKICSSISAKIGRKPSAVIHKVTGRLMDSCFFSWKKRHVST